MHNSGGVNPAWAIGASLVQPARAGKILHDALAHETRSYETAAGELAGALWRIRGPAELDFLVNWFYTGLPTANGPMNQPVAFLWEVAAAARPDTKQLIAALVKDPRFNHTDWESLKEVLKIVNAGRSTPLVPEIFRDTPVTHLGGVAVADSAKVLQIISEGGGTPALRPYLRFVNIINK